ncbi:MAG: acyl carrier protein [Eubacterium sp.]|nr:acyl carrier protein [Eubacterium sp.]
MLEKMKKILSEQLDIDENEITLDSNFKDDLDADSLDLFELLTTLEEQYDIEIPAEDMEGLTTVGKVIDYLQSKGIKTSES